LGKDTMEKPLKLCLSILLLTG